MKHKLTLNDLADRMVLATGLSYEKVEVYLNAFFAQTEEVLLSEQLVKIKGLGDFKIGGVAPRTSVDVNTGKPIVIKGHARISFSADNAVNDKLNAPFAHLTAVEICDEAVPHLAEADTAYEAMLEEEDAETEASNIAAAVETTETIPTAVENPAEALVVEVAQSSNEPPSEGMSSTTEAPMPSESLVESRDTMIEEVPQEQLDGEKENISSDVPEATSDATQELLPEATPEEHVEGSSEDILEEATEPTTEILPDENTAVTPNPALEATLETPIDSTSEPLAVETPKEDSDVTPISTPIEGKETPTEDKTEHEETTTIVHVPTTPTAPVTNRRCKLCYVVLTLLLLIVVFVLYQNHTNLAAWWDGLHTSTTPAAAPAPSIAPATVPVDTATAKRDTATSDSAHTMALPVSPAKSQPDTAHITPPTTTTSAVKSAPTTPQPAAPDYDQLYPQVKGSKYQIIGTEKSLTLNTGKGLMQIAYETYGNAKLYQHIVVYNKIKDPNNVPLGSTIRLPKLRKRTAATQSGQKR